MSFQIEITPALPRAKSSKAISLDGLDHGTILDKHPEKYDIIYYVAGQRYAYYPSSILTVLNDLYEEWTLIKGRSPHIMTLSGYTVLDMNFVDDSVRFLKPLPGSPVGRVFLCECPYDTVEQAFRSATEQVLSFVRSDRNQR